MNIIYYFINIFKSSIRYILCVLETTILAFRCIFLEGLVVGGITLDLFKPLTEEEQIAERMAMAIDGENKDDFEE